MKKAARRRTASSGLHRQARGLFLQHLFLVVDGCGLVEDLEDLLQGGGLVDLLHRGQPAGEAAGSGLENLPLRIALLGLVVGAEEVAGHFRDRHEIARSEEHTSELPSLMRTSYAVFCLKKTTINTETS